MARLCHRWPGRRRGPQGSCSDTELLGKIEVVAAGSLFNGEGDRKVGARLRANGVLRTAARVRRIMLENSLHALQRPVETKEHPHEAAIMTDSMGQRWGTNKTLTATTGEGHAFVFIAVVHCPGELVDTHASSTVPLYTP